MTSKSAKETIVTRLGFKSSSSPSKAEAELEKVRKDNAHLRRKVDELTKRQIKPPDADKIKLLEVNILQVTTESPVCCCVVCLISFSFLFLHFIPEDPVPGDAAREKQSAVVG